MDRSRQEQPTDEMKEFVLTDPAAAHGSPGLVLLYADEFLDLPACWPLTKPQSVLGSSSSADIVLPVAAVSRRHAVLMRRGHGWFIRDEGSTNGVLLDGVPITEAPLNDGQELRIGDAILKFVSRDAEERAHYRIDGAYIGPGARGPARPEQIIGGLVMRRLAQKVELLARSNVSLLLLGETGTGKEVVARALHERSGRKGEFVAINCAGIPESLVESELFGHVAGAFTGAASNHEGVFRHAHRGTLLLDEVAELPQTQQAKLLRFLQSHEVRPLGATEPRPVDVRVVAATNAQLNDRKKRAELGFREDLYARLAQDQLCLPPLRERKEDIFMLLQEFFRRHARGRSPRVSFQFMTGLLHHRWDRNVRELENCVQSCLVRLGDEVAAEEHLPPEIANGMASYGKPLDKSGPLGAGSPRSPESGKCPPREDLEQLLEAHGGNVSAAARAMDVHVTQLRRWLDRRELLKSES